MLVLPALKREGESEFHRCFTSAHILCGMYNHVNA
jgi:hypothetical protein